MAPRVSLMTYSITRGMARGEKFDVQKFCGFMNETGVRDVDWITTYGYPPEDIRRITDGHGLNNACYTFFADLDSGEAEEARKARDDFKKGIEAALELGAGIVMLPVRGSESRSRGESRDNTVKNLGGVMDFAHEAGVAVTVENFPSRFSPFVVSDDVIRLVSELPRVKVTFDNGNVTTGGERASESYKKCAGQVIHAHFKDFERCGKDSPGGRLCLDGNYRRPVMLGEGEVEQAEVLEAMKENGYGGCINFEYEGSEYADKYEAAREGISRMRGWIRDVWEAGS